MHILNNCSGVFASMLTKYSAIRCPTAKRATCARSSTIQAKSCAWYVRRGGTPHLVQRESQPSHHRARSLSSRYTRSKVRKAIPHDYAYIIDELLHTHPDENNYRIRYHERIIDSILETDSTDDFIRSLSALIKRLAVDHLHLVGDVFDRGGGAAKIMDRLMDYHSLDIQWGNHDIVWMGAAAGSYACLAAVIRNNIHYDSLKILESAYGVSCVSWLSLPRPPTAPTTA